jgi:hypothetical protein
LLEVSVNFNGFTEIFFDQGTSLLAPWQIAQFFAVFCRV